MLISDVEMYIIPVDNQIIPYDRDRYHKDFSSVIVLRANSFDISLKNKITSLTSSRIPKNSNKCLDKYAFVSRIPRFLLDPLLVYRSFMDPYAGIPRHLLFFGPVLCSSR